MLSPKIDMASVMISALCAKSPPEAFESNTVDSAAPSRISPMLKPAVANVSMASAASSVLTFRLGLIPSWRIRSLRGCASSSVLPRTEAITSICASRSAAISVPSTAVATMLVPIAATPVATAPMAKVPTVCMDAPKELNVPVSAFASLPTERRTFVPPASSPSTIILILRSATLFRLALALYFTCRFFPHRTPSFHPDRRRVVFDLPRRDTPLLRCFEQKHPFRCLFALFFYPATEGPPFVGDTAPRPPM